MSRNRGFALASAVMVLVVAAVWFFGFSSGDDFIPSDAGGEVRRFGDYEVKIYWRHEETFAEDLLDKLPTPVEHLVRKFYTTKPWSAYEIRHRGRRVKTDGGGNWRIVEIDGGGEVAGKDITGRGIPNLALMDVTARVFERGHFWLFECGKEFREIASIESWGRTPKLVDMDGDGIPELVVSDNAFYHWPNASDGDPMPEVILRWRKDHYTPVKDLMWRPAPAAGELGRLAREIRESLERNLERGAPPPGIWTNTLALLYSGHEKLGRQFLEDAWRSGFPGATALNSKNDLIDRYLRDRLQESVYWPELRDQAGPAQYTTRRSGWTTKIGEGFWASARRERGKMPAAASARANNAAHGQKGRQVCRLSRCPGSNAVPR